MLRDEIKNIDAGKKKLREFGLLVGLVFGLLGFLFLWRDKALYPYFLGIAGFLIVFGGIAPKFLKPIFLAWMTLALLLGWVMARVLLSLLFYLAVTPIALILKVMKKDFLDLKFKDGRESYWVPKKSQLECQPIDYEKQF